MNYSLYKTKDLTVIEVTGKINSGILMSAGSFIRGLNITYPGTVILDVDGLEDQREMFYHVAFINAFKKVIESSGGVLKIRATGLAIRKYLSVTGLKKLFLIDEPVSPADAEV